MQKSLIQSKKNYNGKYADYREIQKVQIKILLSAEIALI